MPKSTANSRKTYTYGAQKKSGKDGWNEVSHSSSQTSTNIPKAKGIWTSISVSPFKKSPLKTLDTKSPKKKNNDDPFNFDDSDNDCFSFKENAKIKKTPSKQPKSPRGSNVNPRLSGKSLSSESPPKKTTPLKLNQSKAGKKQIKDTFKKGTLAALKAELQSPKKSPKKSPQKDTKNKPSPKKGTLAELKMKLQSPKKSNIVKKTSPKKPPVKKSTVKKSPIKKAPVKKSPVKVLSKKVKSPKKGSPKKESPKLQQNRKRKVEISKDEPPIKKKDDRPNKAKKETASKIEKEDVSTSVSNKKRPGRPKKKDSVMDNGTSTDASSQESAGEVSQKKMRVGRPAKTAKTETNKDIPKAPSRKRGRPKKANTEENIVEVKDSILKESMETEHSEETFLTNNSDSITDKNMSQITNDAENSQDMLNNIESSQETFKNIEDNHNTSDDREENEDRSLFNVTENSGKIITDKEPVKTKSVFSYYDKQKKSNENIFAESSKKNLIVFDEEDPTSSENSQSQEKLCDVVVLATPKKSEATEEVSEENEKKVVKVRVFLKNNTFAGIELVKSNQSEKMRLKKME